MRRQVLALGFLALVGPACTVIVGNQLSKYNDYTVSDTSQPRGQKDPCALTDPDAGNTCSACIAQRCAAEVSFACHPDGGKQPWFETMTSCAAEPVTSSVQGSYEYGNCSTYDNPDAEAIVGTGPNDPTAHQRAALICVRDNCYADGTPSPPCNQCSVGARKPGSISTGVAVLHDSQCGQCLEQACGAILLRCCPQGIPDDLGTCAFPQDSDYKAKCLALLTGDAGKEPVPTARLDEKCAYDLATTCYARCVSTCQAGP
jgi:hypothetical protein